MGVHVLLPWMWSAAVLDVSRRSRGTDFADQLRWGGQEKTSLRFLCRSIMQQIISRVEFPKSLGLKKTSLPEPRTTAYSFRLYQQQKQTSL